jgi:hypothetical protein
VNSSQARIAPYMKYLNLTAKIVIDSLLGYFYLQIDCAKDIVSASNYSFLEQYISDTMAPTLDIKSTARQLPEKVNPLMTDDIPDCKRVNCDTVFQY